MIADKERIHYYIYLFCIALLMTGMLFSNFLMSVSEILLVLNWLIEGKLGEKIKSFVHNPTAIVISSLFLLHLVGLIYTSDFQYGFHDIKIKLPLLIMPLILSTSPVLNRKTFLRMMYLFIAVVFAATLVAFYIKLTGRIMDVRKTSVFISHIRFSLHVCLAFFISIYFIFQQDKPVILRAVLALLCIWFVAFLIILEAATGLAIIVAVVTLLLFYLIIKSKKQVVKIPALFLMVFIPAYTAWYCFHTVKQYNSAEKPELTKLDKYTPLGHNYLHDTSYFQVENGRYPGLFVCNEEIESAWNSRSRMKIEKINNGYPMHYYTLIRFLSSKGYRKDAEGIKRLSPSEITAIENGIANAEYLNVFSLKSRIYKIAFEYNLYKRNGDARNMSVMQRFELWKTALNLIQKHFLIGVGTGDVKNAFRDELFLENSTLQDKGLRAHNQYLTFFIAFGVVGMTWFLITLIYPLFSKQKHFHYFFVIFFIIAVMSMFTEDTLETQAGVTLFAFFTSFFIFSTGQKPLTIE